MARSFDRLVTGSGRINSGLYEDDMFVYFGGTHGSAPPRHPGPDLPIDDADYFADREQSKMIFLNRQALNSEIMRARNRPRSELPWANKDDPLCRLISVQLLTTTHGAYSTQKRDLVNIRIREIAAAWSAHLGMPINIKNMLQRTALAAVLWPIYKVYSDYLRSAPEFGYLFNQKRGGHFFVNQLWYDLHEFLKRHGFSIETVHRFIQETAQANVSLHPDRNMTYDNRAQQLRTEDTDPEILQFSLNPPPPAQGIMELMAGPDEERRIALASANHPRLGSRASPLAGLFDHTPEIRNLIFDMEGMGLRHELMHKAGYTGPPSARRSRA